jgi:hypothetical protein
MFLSSFQFHCIKNFPEPKGELEWKATNTKKKLLSLRILNAICAILPLSIENFSTFLPFSAVAFKKFSLSFLFTSSDLMIVVSEFEISKC